MKLIKRIAATASAGIAALAATAACASSQPNNFFLSRRDSYIKFNTQKKI